MTLLEWATLRGLHALHGSSLPTLPRVLLRHDHAGLFQGQGTVWNFSLSGWKLSGDVPLQVGQTCALTVNLPIDERIVVATAIVRWVRGQEFGLETLAIEKQTHSRVEHVIKRLVEESGENIE